MASISGLSSGLDTASIIDQLMQIERLPQSKLQAQKSAMTTRMTAWTAIGTTLTALRNAAEAMATLDKINATTATSNNTNVLTASTATGALPGSWTLRVNQLATAQQRTASGFSSPTQVVGQGTAFITKGLSALGITSLAVDGTVAAGNHSISVDQASAKAVMTGGAVTTPITISNGNSKLALTVNGVASVYTIANGTYADINALRTAVQTAVGTAVTVGTSGSSLTFSTSREGSAATIAMGTTNQSAATDLGLAAAAPVTGTDAKITIDGVQRTITQVSANTTLTVGGWTLGNPTHLSVGTVSVGVVKTTSPTATLQDLATAVNAAGVAATATVVTTASTGLVLTSTKTGTAGTFEVLTSGLSGFGAGFTETRAAQQASITLDGTTVTRDSNSITDVISGVTINLVKAEATDVTLTVAKDMAATTSKVKAIVDGLNGVLGSITTATKYDVANSKAAPLTGDSAARSLTSSVYRIMGDILGTGVTKTLGQIGISVNRDGTYAYDEAKLKAAMEADPAGVASLIADTSTKLATFAKNETTTQVVNGVEIKGTVIIGKESVERRQKDLQTRIDDWDVRLELRQLNLQKKFTALERMMGQMQSQGSWMSGQLNGLSNFDYGGG